MRLLSEGRGYMALHGMYLGMALGGPTWLPTWGMWAACVWMLMIAFVVVYGKRAEKEGDG